MKKRNIKLNNRGFVLLETVIVAVFAISIFTFIYLSVVPLLGQYESLSYENNIDVAYKLYHIRDAIYKDDNFKEIVNENYKRISSNDFNDSSYYNSLTNYLFDNSDYEIIYVRKLAERVNGVISGLSVSKGYGEYIKKIAKTKSSDSFQNFIFLREGTNYAYLGLATSLKDSTNYQESIVIDKYSHKDTSGANAPLLMDGMIPVYYDEKDGNWHKADVTNKSDYHYWYDYKEQMWANVVMVKENREKYQNALIGSEIVMNDIMAFYTWIPRFEYYISGEFGMNDGIEGTSELPGEIVVSFVKSDTEKVRVEGNNTWRTATSFTFGLEELDGFWFAKFEMSNSLNKDYSVNGVGIPFVIPETYSWKGQKIASAYNNITTYMNGDNGSSLYGLTSEVLMSDAHVMKNDEWGAVAYLSQSKYGKFGNSQFSGANKEVYVNNREKGSNADLWITGSSAGIPAGMLPNNGIKINECSTSTSNTSLGCYKYFVPVLGTGASTTGTVYGVYDMSGGMTEMVMGGAGPIPQGSGSCGADLYIGKDTNSMGFKGPYSGSNKCNSSESDYDFPSDSKYYNHYKMKGQNQTVKKSCNATNTLNGEVCYSHAMDETYGWYGDLSSPVIDKKVWYVRGGYAENSSGIFMIAGFSSEDGNIEQPRYTTRPVIAVYNANR